MMWAFMKEFFKSVPCLTKHFLKLLLKNHDIVLEIRSLRRRKEIIHKLRNKIFLCVKGIGRVSPMKSKVTPNNDSPRSRRALVAAVVKEKPHDVIKKLTGKPFVDAVNDKDSKDKPKTRKPTDKVSKGKALDVLKYNRKSKVPNVTPPKWATAEYDILGVLLHRSIAKDIRTTSKRVV
ncbi:hypothetical protein Tco_1505577 [Tanacetum coccineum]